MYDPDQQPYQSPYSQDPYDPQNPYSPYNPQNLQNQQNSYNQPSSIPNYPQNRSPYEQQNLYNQPVYSQQGAYPPQTPYMQQPQMAGNQQQQYAARPRRRRSVSRFQVRIGALGFFACAAGLYLFATGQAKNPMVALALIGGGALVFFLVLVLPALFRR